MTRAEKVRRIQEMLDRLHPTPPIPLAHVDPFTLLVAVVLSAQCTDARVNLVTPALFTRADTPEKMSRLSEREILRLIRSCGLAPSKAKALRGLSQTLVVEHDGRVPDDFASLEALPGVGHKTASVVMAQAFGQPAFPVDTHIHRLAERWGLSSGRNVAETERDLKRAFPANDWDKVHLQMIYFGRAHCPARGHQPQECPICSFAMPKSLLRGGGSARRSPPRPAALPASRSRKSKSAKRPGKTG